VKKIFGILFALVLLVSLVLVTASPVLADGREVSPGWRDIDQVAAGHRHTVGLKSDGTLVAVGDNSDEQCDVGGWANIDQVNAGFDHTVGLKSDDTVVAVGSNKFEQCDVGNWTDIAQITAGDAHTVGLESDGTVVAVGLNSYGQCNVGGWKSITQVAAGFFHTVGLKSDGTVVTVGLNDYGQCDVGGWTDITRVAAGHWHTVGLKSDGTVVAVGNNDYGQCNVGGWTGIIQVAAAHIHTVGLKSDGTVVAVGNNGFGQCDVDEWTGIDQIAAFHSHTVGLESDGTVVAVGDNGYGQCGDTVTETIDGYGIVNAIVEADTEIVVNGTATVTIFKYPSNPHPLSGGRAFASIDLLAEEEWVELDIYVDFSADDIGPGTEFELRVYYTDPQANGFEEDSLRLFWHKGDTWVQCSPDSNDSGVNMTPITIHNHDYSGYMWAKIRNDTTPSLADLQGIEFGGYGHPSEPPHQICFIATAAYGTDRAKEIDILREFRDTILLPNSLGARFVSLYYKTSPPIADFISQHEVLRTTVRVGFVDPIVKILDWTHDLWSARDS
jgi:alpha-tubulin suppressor-like RCC1 family protein